MRNGQWVSRAQLNVEPVVETIVEPVVEIVVDELIDIRAKYQELQPENKEVPVNKKNDKEWIEGKIEEFTKITT